MASSMQHSSPYMHTHLYVAVLPFLPAQIPLNLNQPQPMAGSMHQQGLNNQQGFNQHRPQVELTVPVVCLLSIVCPSFAHTQTHVLKHTLTLIHIHTRTHSHSHIHTMQHLPPRLAAPAPLHCVPVTHPDELTKLVKIEGIQGSCSDAGNRVLIDIICKVSVSLVLIAHRKFMLLILCRISTLHLFFDVHTQVLAIDYRDPDHTVMFVWDATDTQRLSE